MELHGELAIGALERRLVGALRHAEHIIKIAFRQSACPQSLRALRPGNPA